jgi:hypothetical protein
MPLQDALAFLRDARLDEGIGRELEALAGRATWRDLVRVANGAGFSVTSAELQRAFELDWNLRWARYSGTTPEDETNSVAARDPTTGARREAGSP